MTVTVHRILDLMEAYGTTNAFVARLIGKDRTTVSMWKAGKASPTSKDISIIAQHYGVSSAYLARVTIRDSPRNLPKSKKSCSPKRTACPTPSSKRRWSISSF